MDSIQINNIRCYGYTGFLPEERVLGQWFEVNLTLWLDLLPAGKTDNLEKSVDYRQVITLVQHLIKNAKFSLVEKLAAVIAEDILKFDLIQEVRVQLVKVAPPIPDFNGSIQIEITRSRLE